MKFVFRLPFFIAVFIPFVCFCQTSKLDMAKQKIYDAKTNEERLTNLVEFCKLRNSLHGDTIYRYATWARQLAIQLKDERSLAWAEYSIISSDLAKGKTENIVSEIERNKAFQNIRKLDAALYYKVQLLKANALNRMNNRPAALELQLRLLNEAEKDGNINAQLFILNFIGATYLNVSGKAEEGKQTFLKGLQMIRNKPDSVNDEIEAYLLSNLALYYFNSYYVKRTKELRDSFLLTANHCIQLSQKHENLSVLASMLSIRGNFYSLLQEFSLAEKDLLQRLAIRKQIGDPFYITDDLIALANFYVERKQYDQCIATANEGLVTAEKIKIKGLQTTLLAIMAKAYKAKVDFKQYSKLLEQIVVISDSNYQINSAEKIADIQTKYEVQKKETLIAQQKLDLLRKNIFLYAGIVAFVLLLSFLAIRFKKYKRQEAVKMAALMEEEKRQSELAVKDAEEKERKRIAAELHDNLGVQANAILHNSTLLNKSKSSNEAIVADLQETAKEMLHNLRETLWAMKTADVSATDLWLRMINFLKQMGRHYPAIVFKIEGEVAGTHTISSAKALHLILVLQETINNSVKHANASVITVASKYDEKEWRILITDNGKGFNLTEAKTKIESYGLANMKQRSAEGNFDYQIDSAAGSGTKTTLRVANQ
jgi:signal transduction histidine kinase